MSAQDSQKGDDHGTIVMVGTSGFSYKDWKNVFYPAALPQDRWLDHYSENFNFCELNFSYYRMPSYAQLQRYTDYPVQFAIKAHQSLTHDRKDIEVAADEFKSAVLALAESDNLAAILFQFPYSFHHTAQNVEYLEQMLHLFKELPTVVEFRHPAWVTADVIKVLRQNSAGIALTDAPQVKGGMPPFQAVTSPIGYLRFHGRNREQWWDGDNTSRYDYNYSELEIREWLPRISEMARQAQTIYIAFNNHAKGQAIQNARILKKILPEIGLGNQNQEDRR